MNKPDQLKPGSHVPAVDFRVRTGADWVSLKTDEIFSGKTVVIFALPGAFTPTCSSTHLPGYVALSSELKAAGVDEIYCLSVNDSFVMNAWAKEQRVDNEVSMLPDGNGTFPKVWECSSIKVTWDLGRDHGAIRCSSVTVLLIRCLSKTSRHQVIHSR